MGFRLHTVSFSDSCLRRSATSGRAVTVDHQQKSSGVLPCPLDQRTSASSRRPIAARLRYFDFAPANFNHDVMFLFEGTPALYLSPVC